MLGLVPDGCILLWGYLSVSYSPGHSQLRQEPAGLHWCSFSCTGVQVSSQWKLGSRRIQSMNPGFLPGCSQFMLFRQGLWCLQGEIFSEDRLLVAPYSWDAALACQHKLGTHLSAWWQGEGLGNSWMGRIDVESVAAIQSHGWGQCLWEGINNSTA